MSTCDRLKSLKLSVIEDEQLCWAPDLSKLVLVNVIKFLCKRTGSMSDSCEWTWQVLAPCVRNVGYSSHVSFISGRNCSHWCLNRSTVAVVRLKLAGSSTQQLVDNLLEWMYRQFSNIAKKIGHSSCHIFHRTDYFFLWNVFGEQKQPIRWTVISVLVVYDLNLHHSYWTWYS